MCDCLRSLSRKLRIIVAHTGSLSLAAELWLTAAPQPVSLMTLTAERLICINWRGCSLLGKNNRRLLGRFIKMFFKSETKKTERRQREEIKKKFNYYATFWGNQISLVSCFVSRWLCNQMKQHDHQDRKRHWNWSGFYIQHRNVIMPTYIIIYNLI